MDFEVDLSALSSSQSEFEGMKGTVQSINSDVGSSYISKLSGTEISSLSASLLSHVARLEKAYGNSNTWFAGYTKELQELENKLSEFSGPNMTKPEEFKETFLDIFTKATVPMITTAAKKAREEAKALLGSHLKEYSHTGKTGDTGDFYIVNTRIPVKDYEAYIQKNKMYQNAGLLDGQCMVLSQYYAADMLSGKYTRKSTMKELGGGPAVRMNEGCTSPTEDKVLEYVYREVNEGHPVVLQVTQKQTAAKGWRHLVTVVGYHKSVKSAADLTPDKILVLDCVDGKVQTLSERNRRLYNQNKKFLAYGPTEKFQQSIGLTA